MSETATRSFTISLPLAQEADPVWTLAKDMLVENVDGDYDHLCDLFGNALPGGGPPAGLSFRVTLARIDGASHGSCNDTEISVNPEIGTSSGVPALPADV